MPTREQKEQSFVKPCLRIHPALSEYTYLTYKNPSRIILPFINHLGQQDYVIILSLQGCKQGDPGGVTIFAAGSKAGLDFQLRDFFEIIGSPCEIHTQVDDNLYIAPLQGMQQIMKEAPRQLEEYNLAFQLEKSLLLVNSPAQLKEAQELHLGSILIQT